MLLPDPAEPSTAPLQHLVVYCKSRHSIVIRPIRRHTGDDFSVEILKELISLGFSGQELIEQFQIEQNNLKKAVQRMLKEADQIAQGDISGASFDDVFGSED